MSNVHGTAERTKVRNTDCSLSKRTKISKKWRYKLKICLISTERRNTDWMPAKFGQLKCLISTERRNEQNCGTRTVVCRNELKCCQRTSFLLLHNARKAWLARLSKGCQREDYDVINTNVVKGLRFSFCTMPVKHCLHDWAKVVNGKIMTS